MADGRTQIAEPLVVPPAYKVVLKHLRRQIHLGSYAPGEKLPAERTLAPQLGVSRVTLREAIRVLEAEGYVTTRRGATGGVFVRERSETQAELRARARKERDRIGALLEFRLANERLAVERAATRIGKSELAALERTLEDLRLCEGVGAFRQADSKFHLMIAAAADCELLRDAIEEARVQLFLPLDAIGYEVLTESTIRGHEKILGALRDGDAAAAGRAMARHLAVTSGEVDSMLAGE